MRLCKTWMRLQQNKITKLVDDDDEDESMYVT